MDMLGRPFTICEGSRTVRTNVQVHCAADSHVRTQPLAEIPPESNYAGAGAK
jgi:hypothetical protein